MDDKDIITLMFLSKSDAYLAMRLFKAKGYGKNKIKRLVYNELREHLKYVTEYYYGYEVTSWDLSEQIILLDIDHLIYSELHHKFSSHYSISEVWKHLKIKFNKIR